MATTQKQNNQHSIITTGNGNWSQYNIALIHIISSIAWTNYPTTTCSLPTVARQLVVSHKQQTTLTQHSPEVCVPW